MQKKLFSFHVLFTLSLFLPLIKDFSFYTIATTLNYTNMGFSFNMVIYMFYVFIFCSCLSFSFLLIKAYKESILSLFLIVFYVIMTSIFNFISFNKSSSSWDSSSRESSDQLMHSQTALIEEIQVGFPIFIISYIILIILTYRMIKKDQMKQG